MRADHVWQGSYQAAILETDDNKLPNRLQAKAAVDDRIHELQTDHGGTPRGMASHHRCAWWAKPPTERITNTILQNGFQQYLNAGLGHCKMVPPAHSRGAWPFKYIGGFGLRLRSSIAPDLADATLFLPHRVYGLSAL